MLLLHMFASVQDTPGASIHLHEIYIAKANQTIPKKLNLYLCLDLDPLDLEPFVLDPRRLKHALPP